MKKGTRVSWLAEGATVRGHGTVISDEADGKVLVAVDKGTFEHIPMAYHVVIQCTVTWLTEEPAQPKPVATIRAKFRVDKVTPSTDPEGGGTVRLWPVCGGSPENERFYRLTPGGEISLGTINQNALDAFKSGKEFYVDFTPCEQPVPQAPPVDNAHVADGCEKFTANPPAETK